MFYTNSREHEEVASRTFFSKSYVLIVFMTEISKKGVPSECDVTMTKV